jgi:very-short-patch-repair endonuclease
VGRHRRETAERRLARIANRAEGIVTRQEALGAGVTAAQIRHRLDTGALTLEFPGVYRLGHRAPSVAAHYVAAVKASGEGAGLSGTAAAWFYGLLRGLAPQAEVTAPRRRRLKGVTTHHARRAAIELTVWRRMPITTVPRTLVDIAGRLDEDELARTCHEAGVKHGVTPAMVEAILTAHSNLAGAAKLRTVMRGETRVTLSQLERRFLERLTEAGLPLPVTNRPVGSHRVDCRWPEHRLTVELDSYRFHNSRHSWRLDREREREARQRGDEFRRYDYDDVFVDPAFMLRDLANLLSRGAVA